MKVLLMAVIMTSIALRIKIEDLIPMQAEQFLPVSALKEVNGNTTTQISQIFLQGGKDCSAGAQNCGDIKANCPKATDGVYEVTVPKGDWEKTYGKTRTNEYVDIPAGGLAHQVHCHFDDKSNTAWMLVGTFKDKKADGKWGTGPYPMTAGGKDNYPKPDDTASGVTYRFPFAFWNSVMQTLPNGAITHTSTVYKTQNAAQTYCTAFWKPCLLFDDKRAFTASCFEAFGRFSGDGKFDRQYFKSTNPTALTDGHGSIQGYSNAAKQGGSKPATPGLVLTGFQGGSPALGRCNVNNGEYINYEHSRGFFFWIGGTVPESPTEAATEAATDEPGKRSDLEINLDFSKLVHEKFSQEAAHGTWNLQLNLDTDPCSLLTCVAESQCHAVGKCTKEGGGVCSTPFLAKDTPCDDGAEDTVNDVCDGKGLCAGVDIGLGCLEMRYDASKFKEGYAVKTWEDLAEKGHLATAVSTVPAVKMDETDKKRPYVPVYNGRYWNVEGNTFVKTVVSVIRAGDGRTTWDNYGAPLGRRSGRGSNQLFHSGTSHLYSSEYPDRVWKNGQELNKANGFNLAPINKFFIFVVEVNDNSKGAAAYYLGRSDHSGSRMDMQEVMAYDRKLTDDERESVEEFLAKKWNIEQ